MLRSAYSSTCTSFEIGHGGESGDQWGKRSLESSLGGEGLLWHQVSSTEPKSRGGPGYTGHIEPLSPHMLRCGAPGTSRSMALTQWPRNVQSRGGLCLREGVVRQLYSSL